MGKQSASEVQVARQLAKEGWLVVNTNSGFPDLFCVMNGTVRPIEVKRKPDKLHGAQEHVISRLRGAGVDVVIKYVDDNKKMKRTRSKNGWVGANIREEDARKIEAIIKERKKRWGILDYTVPMTVTAFVNDAVYEKLTWLSSHSPAKEGARK